MSKNKKKKNKRKANPETWNNVKLGLSTLLSNDACIRAAREWHGPIEILPVGLALAAVVLAVLPTFVTRMNTRPSDYILNSVSANYETGLASMLNTLVYDGNGGDRELALNISADGKTFEFSTADRQALCGENNKWYTINRNIDGVKTPVFEAFFNYEADLSDTDFFTRIDAYNDPFGGNERKADVTEFQASYIAFGHESIRFRPRSGNAALTGITGSYQLLAGRNLTAFAKGLKEANLKYTSEEYLKRVRNEFSTIVNLSTEPAKVTATWQQTGIFAAIDLGLIILFGGLLFLMTRGKKNPYRIFNFWETEKMAAFASFTPSVLAMALGFWLTQYAFILFMFAFGMRMMWMSMRSMRPMQE